MAEAGLIRANCSRCYSRTSEEALLAARNNTKQVTAKRLGAVGPDGHSPPIMRMRLAHGLAVFGAEEPFAHIPFVVEAWANQAEDTSLSAA